MLDQHRAPVWEALEEMRREKLVPFDVPGHKRGRGNKELMDFLGERCLSVDVNSTKYLDSLCHPTGILMEGEELAAEAFGASAAFFMVGGTTASIQAMIFFTSAMTSGPMPSPARIRREGLAMLRLRCDRGWRGPSQCPAPGQDGAGFQAGNTLLPKAVSVVL